MMTLNPNWKLILKKAWSVRLLVLAGILSGTELILPMYAEAIPRGWFAALSLLITSAALVMRFIAQKEFGDAQ